jgi:hypothetical protein
MKERPVLIICFVTQHEKRTLFFYLASDKESKILQLMKFWVYAWHRSSRLFINFLTISKIVRLT